MFWPDALFCAWCCSQVTTSTSRRVIHLRLKWTFFIITKALFTGKLQPPQRLLFAQESEESHSSTSKHRHENTPSPQHYSGPPPYFIGRIGTLVSVSLCCDTFIRCLNLNAAFSGKCGERRLHLWRAGFVLCVCCPRYSFTTVMTVVIQSQSKCVFSMWS